MKRLGLILVLVGLGVVALVAGFLLMNKPEREVAGTQTRVKQFSDNTHQVSLEYPTEATQAKLSDEDIADNFIFRATQGSKRPYLITLRYEDGLRTASQLSKTSTIELLLSNTDKALPTRYPGFKKLSESRFDQGGKQVARVDFTYTGNDGQEVHQALYIFLRDENKAFYLTIQSKATDFNELEPTFKKVAESFKF